MTTRQQPSLLGLPEYLENNKVLSIRFALEEMWKATIGSPPGELGADLDKCKQWFDPVAQGKRLRNDITQLQELPSNLTDPGPPLTILVGPGKALVTPEGRCALELLSKLGSQGPHIITDDLLTPYERRLGLLYRSWSRHRLQSVVNLLLGKDKPLQIPAAGVVLALLVNRSTAEARALIRFSSGSPKDLVDRAFFGSVEAFVRILTPRRKAQTNNPRLLSGWMLGEARRRLGESLVVLDAKGVEDIKIWISTGTEDMVIDIVARDLARGHRSKLTPEILGSAFDALVDSLRRELPTLAAFGLVHERPRDTQQLRENLLSCFRRYVE